MPDTLPHIRGLSSSKFERDRERLVVVDDPKSALPSGFYVLENRRVFGEGGVIGVDGTDTFDAQHHERLLFRAIRKQIQPPVVEAERIGMNPVAPGSVCRGSFVRDITPPRLQEGWYEAMQDVLCLRSAIHFIVLRKREESPAELPTWSEVMLQERGDL